MEPPKCRLFLRAARFEGARDCLAAALEAGDVASLLIAGEDAARMMDELLPLARARDVAVLVEEDAPLCARSGADGVEVGACDALRGARETLGRDAIVGVRCSSRHAAMAAAEAGADYVAFPSQPGPDSLIGWWSPLFVVPCVAADPCEPEEARELARTGADFVRPSDRMWQSPQAAREVCRATMAAIGAVHA